ncbi:MAG TPA: nitronate monooxygenase [Planctomycetes bacterium]|nr:nitronate monooxygenase [Planctomycetota bacterium]
MKTKVLPSIIQGGLGAGVSGWPLARTVSMAGGLGVVAGTALDVILARRLQAGDPGGHMRRALDHFPIPGIGKRILDRYFLPSGKAPGERFRPLPLMDENESEQRRDLLVAANFAEVFLAKEGHDGEVGINLLEKIQLPTLPSLYGAMLAGVGTVLMGAGIPRAIPSFLDAFAEGKAAELALDVRGAEPGSSYTVRFDPADLFGGPAPRLPRPRFFAIVSSNTVATVMAKKASGRVDGLVIEGFTAGGHNAPPRGALQLNEDGEPIFGERDIPKLSAIAKLGLPFWLAGGHASPEAIREAHELGAAGVQIGTAFAFSDESGTDPEFKRRARAKILAGNARVLTDGRASPTGFPFKVFQLEGTVSEPEVFHRRSKVCDLGYLRHAYLRENGKLGWRCPAEPEDIYLKKGGKVEEIVGRKCVCNGLMATIGLGQVQKSGEPELPILTSGSDTSVVAKLLEMHGGSYSARDVMAYLLEGAVAVG